MNMAVPVNIFHLERARLDLGLLDVPFPGIMPCPGPVTDPTAAAPTSTVGLHMAAADGDTATTTVHIYLYIKEF